MGIDKDELITDLRPMTQAVQDRGGKIVLQLGYDGGYLSKSRFRMLTERDMKEVVENFGRAALRAKKAACISCNNCVEQIKKSKGLSCVPREEKKERFFPQLSETIPAAPPFPPGTNYRVSIGLEEWKPMYLPVIKIEMIINGQVSSIAPSFPLGSGDHEKINDAIAELLEKETGIHTRNKPR